MRRALVLLSLAVALTVQGTASAQGWKLKGYLVTHPTAVSGMTGSCQCNWQWFTMGLLPGPLRVTGSLGRNGPPVSGTYALLVSLVHQGHVVQTATAACLAKAKKCRSQLSLSRSVGEGGVYYLLVHGEGSNGMTFRIRINGRIYPMRCQPYCR